MKEDPSASPHAAPKVIHDFRTQARRIGIVAKLCRDQKSRIKSTVVSALESKKIEATRRACGPVREIDVLLDLIESRHSEWFSRSTDAECHQMMSWLHKLREQAESAIIKSWNPHEELPKAQKVASTTTNRLQALSKEERLRVLGSLNHLLTEAAKLGNAKHLTSKQLHRVRRRIRDCRYAIETLSIVGWIPVDAHLVKTLRKMQTKLGTFTDIEASKKVVEKLRGDSPNSAIQKSLETLSRNLKQERQVHIDHLRDVVPEWSRKLRKWSKAFPN